MNPKELRLGNLVETYTVWLIDDKVSEPAIGTKEIDLKDLEIMQSSLATYRGIPLTEEWLIKVGFIEKDLGEEPPYYIFEHQEINGFKVWEFNGEHWILELADQNAIPQNHFKYLHQLQNMYFALTGEELIIKEPLTH